ncbi:hypothetical protein [Piscinibacter sp.]|uniref:hypothetical protein n=1 Tax=Piscinibacter sp. TaxID=1903157 RepID=UPI0035B3E766
MPFSAIAPPAEASPPADARGQASRTYTHSILKRPMLAAVPLIALCGCAATTSTHFTPSPQQPVCHVSSTAVVVWSPQWRADQKDVQAREVAASEGIARFFQVSGCFASVSLRRVPQLSAPYVESAASEAGLRYDTLVGLAVRELGPVVKLGSSAALVEGGTEVVLDIQEYKPPNEKRRSFSVHWRNGGPGIIKGVATLPQDIEAALAAALQPGLR